MSDDVKTTTIPRLRRSIYCAKGDFPTTDLRVGDFAFATDEIILYRWNGTTWQAITSPSRVSNGSYTGNDTVNRAIAHGLTVIPTIIILRDASANAWGIIMIGTAFVQSTDHTAWGAQGVTASDVTNFYVGNAASYAESFNFNGNSYIWVAIG